VSKKSESLYFQILIKEIAKASRCGFLLTGTGDFVFVSSHPLPDWIQKQKGSFSYTDSKSDLNSFLMLG
jgi:hypothetical protein